MLQKWSKTVLSARQFLGIFLSSNSFHIFSKTTANILANPTKTTFLKPAEPAVVQSCGFKVVGRVERRCRDCYFVFKHGRLYNLCKTHPRHKQMSMVKDERNTWILTHATQGKVRPW